MKGNKKLKFPNLSDSTTMIAMEMYAIFHE
jgi:hypothetical protein